MHNEPLYLVISGIDGSGKTTLIKGVQNALEARRIRSLYSWMRYTHICIKPLHALARLTGLTRRYETPSGRVWRHEFYRYPAFARVYIPLTFIDVWLGRLRLRRAIAASNPDVVICDRWINDVLIDLAVDFHSPALIVSNWARRFRELMPAEAQQIVILRDRRAIEAIRPEDAGDADFDLRLSLYLDLARVSQTVQNEGSIDEAVATIVRMIPPVVRKTF